MGLGVTATNASAQECGLSPMCICITPASRAGTGVSEAIEGGRTTIRIESASVGLDAGTLLQVPREPGEAVGERWFVLDDARLFVDDAGTVTCRGFTRPRVPVELMERAVAGEACFADLEAGGLMSPPCKRHCAVAPELVLAGLLAWFLRRRRE